MFLPVCKEMLWLLQDSFHKLMRCMYIPPCAQLGAQQVCMCQLKFTLWNTTPEKWIVPLIVHLRFTHREMVTLRSCLRVMLKIMKPAKNSISGTFILLWHVLHCAEHFFWIYHFVWAIVAPIKKWSHGIKVGVHFSCFMTILSHFGFIIFSMTLKNGWETVQTQNLPLAPRLYLSTPIRTISDYSTDIFTIHPAFSEEGRSRHNDSNLSCSRPNQRDTLSCEINANRDIQSDHWLKRGTASWKGDFSAPLSPDLTWYLARKDFNPQIKKKNATWRWQWAHLEICISDMHYLR